MQYSFQCCQHLTSHCGTFYWTTVNVEEQFRSCCFMNLTLPLVYVLLLTSGKSDCRVRRHGSMVDVGFENILENLARHSLPQKLKTESQEIGMQQKSVSKDMKYFHENNSSDPSLEFGNGLGLRDNQYLYPAKSLAFNLSKSLK